MSLKKNILANYASQLYIALIGIVMVPLYVPYMGIEAYGLVGFFAMLQAWFQLLDMGLTPTMARAAARFNGGASDALTLRRLLRALEGIFVAIALLGCIALIAGSDVIAANWLKVDHLPLVEVQHAIQLMAMIVALRWVSGLYRGTISGFERFVWLSGFNVAIATGRFVLVIPFFIHIGASPTHFFSYQLVVAVIELLLLTIQTYRLMPELASGQRARWQWEPLRDVLKFSLSVAFITSVWVLVTQTDKLVLSKLLPLTEYAYFVLAVQVAAGIGVISGPVGGGLCPRMTKLTAAGDDEGMIRLYRNATQLVGITAIPAALVLVFFGEQVLWAWTGDIEIARRASPILRLYALGNGILALSSFPYYLQFAKGDLKLHLIGNVLFLVLLIPALIWATLNHGVMGAGYAWAGANLAYFMLWVPMVHARFVKGLHVKWLVGDVMTIFLLSIVGIILLQENMIWPIERISVGVKIVEVGMVLLVLAGCGSSWVRERLRGRWQMYLRKC